MIKRGQISIFIIIAIILVGLVAIFFLVKGGISSNNGKVDTEVQPIYDHIKECIKEVGEDSIEYIGQTGGYYDVSELSTETNIAYYVHDNKNIMPSKEKIEEEIESYVNNMIYFCNNEFVDFPDYEISVGEINTEAKIKNGKVVFNSKVPLSILNNEKTYTFEDFDNIEIASRLDSIYEMAFNISEEEASSEGTCMSCIIELALEKDLFVEMYDYDEETTIFVIRDEDMKINNKNYKFYFAIKK